MASTFLLDTLYLPLLFLDSLDATPRKNNPSPARFDSPNWECTAIHRGRSSPLLLLPIELAPIFYSFNRSSATQRSVQISRRILP